MERRSPFCRAVAASILILALSPLAQARYGGGTGEPNDPYLIYTPEQMNAIGADPNDWDKHFKLMANIDLAQYTGTEFNLIGALAPIEIPSPRNRNGSNDTVVEYVLIPFTGTFDGGGYVIANFTYTCGDVDRVGLFGYVADPNASISNLELLAPHVYVEGAGAVGSLVGRLEDGAIANCYVNEALVLAEAVSHVGALAGNVTRGSVASCGSNRSIVLSEDGPSGDEWYAGGLVGSLREGTMTDCHADGGFTSGDSSAGGLLGANLVGTVDSCWATLTVTGQVDVGGLIGTNIGIVRNAYASGDVWGDTRIGGLAGNNTGTRGRGVGVSGRGEITSCYATGTVIGEEYVGGLVGAGPGPIAQCYATGDTTGDFAVGGLVGDYGWGTISACHARGTVIGDEMVGGLIGIAGGQCTVTACYATGNVQGGETVGGLVGENTANIIACYATGRVRGEGAVGGLCGSIKWDGQAGGCFWDIETSGQTESAGGTGLTMSEMQTAETFLEAGWDFVGEVANGEEDIWYLAEGDYPRLAWELEEVPAPAAEVIELDETNFSETIAEGVVLVDFYATWCSHCVTQAPILDEVAGQVQGIAQVRKLDIDAARPIAQAYGVTAIPTLIVFKDGDVFERFLGVTQTPTLVAAIERALAYQPRPR